MPNVVELYAQYDVVIVAIMLALLLIMLIWMLWLTRQMRRLAYQRHARLHLREDGVMDAEAMIQHILDLLDHETERLRQIEEALHHLHATVHRQAGHIGIVRFNPFQETGGNQSFAIAIVDAEGNGVSITSLYSRDGTRMYAKPLVKGESPYALSEEEREAIAIALKERPPQEHR